MRRGKIVSSQFRPAWWLPGGHLQTLWPFFFRRPPRLALSAERLELPDGDFVDLRLTPPASGPVVAVFHGLEGCVDSHYARPLLAAIHRAGWRGAFMHFRGCGGEHNRLARSYHSGDTGDIAFLLERLGQRFPGVPLAAVGYSLGGNALLKYLGEAERRGRLRAAAAVSVPYLLAVGAERLNRGFSKVYRRHLLRLLRDKVSRKFAAMDCPIDINNISQLNDFFKFDERVTAPLHGFDSARDYYAQSSSRQYLKSIDVPALLIHARDDPFMTEAVLPAATELSPSVQLELTQTGGHIGFVGGALPGRAAYWLEGRIMAFLSQHLR